MYSPFNLLLYADHYMHLIPEPKVKHYAHPCRIMKPTFMMLNHVSLLAEYALS
jgi:hypothetical protein